MATLTLNTGSNIFQTGAPTAGAGNSSTAQNPYSVFSQNMVNMLQNAQAQTNKSNTALTAQRENLTNQGLAESDPSGGLPFGNLLRDTAGNTMTGGMSTVQNAVTPGITSINDQIQLNNSALQNANDIANTNINAITASANAGIGKYSPMINPDTGKMDGYNSATGAWLSQAQGATPPSNLAATGGVDFTGTATSTAPYATDPNYSKEVGGAYSTIQAQMPTFDPTTADQYIDMHAPKSPVTGQMILTAANTYGVDPTLLMAQMQHESDFGTSGAATTTMNPGNVGNTGTSTKAYQSWQAGVNGMAYEDAPGAYWLLLGPGLEYRRTVFQARESDYPDEWPSGTRDEAISYFETRAV